MRCTVLFASPRGERSNTLALLGPWLEAWRSGRDTRPEVFSLYDMDIKPLLRLPGLSERLAAPACVVRDDMSAPFSAVCCKATCSCWPRPSTPGSAHRP